MASAARSFLSTVPRPGGERVAAPVLSAPVRLARLGARDSEGECDGAGLVPRRAEDLSVAAGRRLLGGGALRSRDRSRGILLPARAQRLRQDDRPSGSARRWGTVVRSPAPVATGAWSFRGTTRCLAG